MFELRDGRECLWQWDTDVQLIVSDPTITEVHFCNKTDECSLVCEVYEEDGYKVVNIPNILLQTDWAIRVYAYCANHTKQEKTLKVHRRSKPADYVYTETELKSWEKVEQQIDFLESLLTTEGVAKAVTDYLEENPVGVPDEYVTETELEEYVDTAISNINVSNVGQPGAGVNAEIFNNYEQNTATGNYAHAEGNNTHASVILPSA